MPRRRGNGSGGSHHVKIQQINAWARVATTAIKWGGLIGCAYCFYLCVDALAGQQTTANIVMQLVTQMGISRWLAYAIGGCGLIYGLQQRKLRRQAIGRPGQRIKELEARLDPERSSSQLDDAGRTPPDA